MGNAMLFKRYRLRLFRELPGSGSQKKEMMESMLSGVEDFLEDHPEANYKTLTEHFGTPKQVAESYWAVNGGKAAQHTALLMAMLRVVAALALFVAITWGIMVVIVTADFYEEEKGHITEKTSECQTEEKNKYEVYL